MDGEIDLQLIPLPASIAKPDPIHAFRLSGMSTKGTLSASIGPCFSMITPSFEQLAEFHYAKWHQHSFA